MEEHREGSDEEGAPRVVDEEYTRKRRRLTHVRTLGQATRVVRMHGGNLLLGPELSDVCSRSEEKDLERACKRLTMGGG
jgi:hypothetical protein